MFSIKVWWLCTIHKPVRMLKESFEKLHLPDPGWSLLSLYRALWQIHIYRASTKQGRKGRQKTLPFSASVQECWYGDVQRMWDMASVIQQTQAQQNWTACSTGCTKRCHTCGAQIQELELSSNLAEDIRCYEPIEKLYYSVERYELICIYCASEESLDVNNDFLSTMLQCSEKEKVKKRK